VYTRWFISPLEDCKHNMHNFLPFFTQHWALWLAFGVILALVIGVELGERLRGARAISAHSIVKLINQHEAVVVDIRDEAAFNKAHILGALSIPRGRLATEIKKLEKYRSKPIVLVCELGQHAPGAGIALKQQQFTQVYCLQGGLNAWVTAGLPLKRA
jgi:rhodanese-related sulfurtransferase